VGVGGRRISESHRAKPQSSRASDNRVLVAFPPGRAYNTILVTSCLIGYSGFIGSNLARQRSFTDLYRSVNIREIEGKHYDLVVCSAISAAKWRANQNPEDDRAAIDRLLDSLRCVRMDRIILISTIDVYPAPQGVDESSNCADQPNHAYGVNRLYAETAIQALVSDAYVVRLPGVFGSGLKKNVIYDLINDNCLDIIQPDSVFQYYDVGGLSDDLDKIQDHRIRLTNLAAEPIATRSILDAYFPGKRVGERAGPPVRYNVRSRHAELWGGSAGYQFGAAAVLERLGVFIHSARQGVNA
jgi:hypothetical protein